MAAIIVQEPKTSEAAPSETSFWDRISGAFSNDTAKIGDEFGKMSKDAQKLVTEYYEYAKNSEPGKKIMGMAEYAKNKGVEITEEAAKQAGSFWDTYAPQGLKEAAQETGNFLSNNKFGLGAGILAMILGMAMGGMDMIGGLIMGLLAFAAISAFGGDGENGLLGSLFGGKKEDKNERGAGLAKDAPVMAQVLQKDKDGNPLWKDKDGNSKDMALTLNDAEGKEFGKVIGKVDEKTKDGGFVVTQIAMGNDMVTLEKPINVKINEKGEININDPALVAARKNVAETRPAYGLDKDADGKLTAAELDLNKDGKLTAEDQKLIAAKINNEAKAKALFDDLGKQGVSFSDQKVAEVPAQLNLPKELQQTRGKEA